MKLAGMVDSAFWRPSGSLDPKIPLTSLAVRKANAKIQRKRAVKRHIEQTEAIRTLPATISAYRRRDGRWFVVLDGPNGSAWTLEAAIDAAVGKL